MLNNKKTQQELPQAAKLALQRGRVIDAIKTLREEYGLGLFDAKLLVERYSGQATESDSLNGDSQSSSRWVFWIPAIGAFGPLYDASLVYSAGSLAASHVCNRSIWHKGGAICTYAPDIGTKLFDANRAYMGYVMLALVLATLMILLTVFLLRRKV